MRSSSEPMASPRRHRGITLAEVLVVLVIVGILVGLAAPSFSRSQGESRLDGDAAKLSTDVQWTRLLATKSGNRAFLLLSGSGRNWSVWIDRDSSLSLDTTKDSVVKRDALGVSVRYGFGFGVPSPIAVLGSSVPSSGFGSVQAGNVEDCVSGSAYPASTPGVATWAYGAADGLIVACGGSTADIGNGALYLTSTRSNNKAYAIVFNHVTGGSESFAVRRYKWTQGGTWLLQ